MNQKLFAAYRAYVRAAISTGARKSEKNCKPLLKKFPSDIPLSAFNAEYVDCLVARMKKAGLKNSTVAGYLHIVKAFLRDCKKKRLSVGISADEIVIPTFYRKKSKLPTEQQIARFLQLVEESGDQAALLFIQIAKNTGMRRGEILSLKWEDVKQKQRIIRVRERGAFRIKEGGEEKEVPLNRELAVVLAEASTGKNRNSKIFPKLKPSRLQYQLRRFMRKAGISNECRTTHFWRMRLATRLLNERGSKIQDVADILGHRSLNTTRDYYLKKDLGRLAEILDALN